MPRTRAPFITGFLTSLARQSLQTEYSFFAFPILLRKICLFFLSSVRLSKKFGDVFRENEWQLGELEVFQAANCVKVNPDSPQKQVRLITLSGQSLAFLCDFNDSNCSFSSLIL